MASGNHRFLDNLSLKDEFDLHGLDPRVLSRPRLLYAQALNAKGLLAHDGVGGEQKPKSSPDYETIFPHSRHGVRVVYAVRGINDMSDGTLETELRLSDPIQIQSRLEEARGAHRQGVVTSAYAAAVATGVVGNIYGSVSRFDIFWKGTPVQKAQEISSQAEDECPALVAQRLSEIEAGVRQLKQGNNVGVDVPPTRLTQAYMSCVQERTQELAADYRGHEGLGFGMSVLGATLLSVGGVYLGQRAMSAFRQARENVESAAIKIVNLRSVETEQARRAAARDVVEKEQATADLATVISRVAAQRQRVAEPA